MKQKKEIKRIKENITEVEYKKLMTFVRGNETFRENTKLNLAVMSKIFVVSLIFPNKFLAVFIINESSHFSS